MPGAGPPTPLAGPARPCMQTNHMPHGIKTTGEEQGGIGSTARLTHDPRTSKIMHACTHRRGLSRGWYGHSTACWHPSPRPSLHEG